MTTDGYYADEVAVREWEQRHADLAATLRTVLAMCAHTEQHHPGGPRFLAASIRELITGTEMPRHAAQIAVSRPATPSPSPSDPPPASDAQRGAQQAPEWPGR